MERLKTIGRFAVPAILSVALAALIFTASGVGGVDDGLSDGGSVAVVDGITVVTLTGTPRQMGRQHGRLLGDRMLETEAAFKSIMPPIPGGIIGEWLVRTFVMFQLGGIEKHLTESELEEMKGMADSGPDSERDYRDLLYYHVLQDIGQNYACTGAALTGRRSAAGGPLAGRNFDLNKDGALDPLKTVFCYIPDDGPAYATVAWPGMAGAVSGINEHGVAVMVFSAKSEETSLSGVPVAFIARRILSSAEDIDDAVEIVSSVKRMGPNAFLVADSREAAVIEFDTERVAVRRAEGGLVVAANHFMCDVFCSDTKNKANARLTDTTQRFDRMEQILLPQQRTDTANLLSALRDHNGPDDRVMCWGDPAAINNVKDAHTIMFDTRGKQFWVSTPPMGYGRMPGFRLGSKGLRRSNPLPASEYPDSHKGRSALMSFKNCRDAGELASRGLKDDAVAAGYEALAADPGNYMASNLVGDLMLEQYRYDEAYIVFDNAVYHAPGCSSSLAVALAGRGEAARHTGRTDSARADFDAVIEMDCCEDATDIARKGLSRM